MGNATRLLFGLDGFRVVSVMREHKHDEHYVVQHDDDAREVLAQGCWMESFSRPA